MILEFIFNIIVDTVLFIFNLFPDLPDLPQLKRPFEVFMTVLGYGMDILSVVLDVSLFKPFLLVVLGLILFRKVYFMIKFVIDKLPFLKS